MDLFDRIFALDRLLRGARVPVSRTAIQARLECSRATAGRVIGRMRLYLDAPIVFDRRSAGYRYEIAEGGRWELPGLWFNASELHALLAAHQLLANALPGLLEEDLGPLASRIERILASRGVAHGEVGRRVRILRMAARRPAPGQFRAVAGALLGRRRLRIVYHGRARDAVTEREVSPQRLTHYRDNWYLDAWDHGVRALRSFSVDRIREVRALGQRAKEISDAKLDGHFASAYGIFAGRPRQTAVLRFSPESSRWVADEVWHPHQKGEFRDGHYVLEVPYGDSRELVRDILKHGAEVTVQAPGALRDEVKQCLREAHGNYED